MKKLRIGRCLVGGLIIGGLFLWRLEAVPPLWWDEGWTIAVAHNWATLGHYGRLLDGVPVSSRLAAAFPVVAPVALSFRLFGSGVWQARLPGVLFGMASITWLYFLACKLFSRKVARGTMAVLFFLPIASELHPALNARQVLGEMPALFYLLTGSAFFLWGMERSVWYLVGAVLSWGVAYKTKAQIPPFWLASLLLPLGVSLIMRWSREAMICGLSLIGGVGTSFLVSWVARWAIGSSTPPLDSLTGLYQITALVPDWEVRATNLVNVVSLGLLPLLGLSYGVRALVRETKVSPSSRPRVVVKWSLLGLGGSWFAWYALSAMVWIRYLFPAFFISSVFVAEFLSAITSGFHFRETITTLKILVAIQREHQIQIRKRLASLGILIVFIWVALAVIYTGVFLYFAYFRLGSTSVQDVTHFLNTETPLGSRVETYESELFFLLERPYHYPPDQVSVQMIQRAFLDARTPLRYDALETNPDYLVIGRFSHRWHIYDNVLQTGAFTLVKTFPGYEIYKCTDR